MKFVLGKKSGMTTIYNENGAQNVTLISVEPNVIDLIRNSEKDGYNAVRVSIDKTSRQKCQREFRVDDVTDYKVNDQITVEVFSVGEYVHVSAPSKAKGFQGVVKRHGFKGGPKSHGHRHVLRQAGSIGCAFPEHVLKGKKMAGRMGNDQVTVKGLKIVKVLPELKHLYVSGAVPGARNSSVEVKVI